MLWFLLLLILIALLLQGSWSLWPNRSIFWLLSWRQKKFFKVFFDGVDVQIDTPCIVIATEPSAMLVHLIKRLTPLAVTWVTHDSPRGLLAALSRKANLHYVRLYEPIRQWHQVVVIAARDFHNLKQPLDLPILLAYVCGIGEQQKDFHMTPRILQLSTLPYTKTQGEALLHALNRLSVYAWEHYVDKLPSIVELWLQSAKAGKNKLAIADSTGTKLTHHRLITAVMTLRAKLFNVLAAESHVGLCLPPSVGGASALMTLLCLGKTIVNLNYTSSKEALEVALQEARIKIVITSRRFLEQLTTRGFQVVEVFANTTVIFLEDIRKTITQRELFKNYLIVKFAPTRLLKSLMAHPVASNKVATILFSSGSEGKPKGVELTHKNIVGNAKQSVQGMAANQDDVIMGILPIFHAFGLTATTLLPLIEGITLICHPDPTDTATIGQLVHDYKGTILCGTSTFLRLYAKARNIMPADFQSLRLVVAGAEKLLPEVRVLFEEKFKKMIYEGYGTTELSPVAFTNQPDTPFEVHHKMGTVGQAIEGVMARILDPDTNAELPIGEAGMIAIGGVNVMRGYLNDPKKTSEAIVHDQNIRWYKTGDKGRLDEQGFLTILDRYSRFAKIGGEMLSLGAIEAQINLLLNQPETEILAVAIPDLKKGEQIVLLYTGGISEAQIKTQVQHSEMLNLMKPAAYLHVETIPKLGTGKTDFAAAKNLVLAKLRHA